MIMMRYLYGNHINSGNFSSKFEDGGLEYHTDIPRIEEGLSSGAFWSAFLPCPSNGTDFSDEAYAPSKLFCNLSCSFCSLLVQLH